MRGLGSGHVTCGPMRGLKKCIGRGQTHKQTNRQTHGHRDSMTESAQWADSVKRMELGHKTVKKIKFSHFFVYYETSWIPSKQFNQTNKHKIIILTAKVSRFCQLL